jgi:hypothetical protein
MNARKGALAFTTAMLLAGNVLAAEGNDASRGPFGALHPEVAATVMASPSLPQFQYGAPGPIGGAWGLRAGASFQGFYGGLTVVDFPGESVCLDSYPSECSSSHATSFGADLGYGDIFFRWLLVRGVLGTGDYFSTRDGQTGTCTADGCTTTSFHRASHNLYFQPGVLVGAMMGPILVAGDASWLYMPIATRPGATASSSFAALYLGGQLGVRF